MSTKDITDLQVCEAVRDYRFAGMVGPYPNELLETRTGQCRKVCFRAMERAERRGYLEYGVSLRTAWLTDAGERLLWPQTRMPLLNPVEAASANFYPRVVSYSGGASPDGLFGRLRIKLRSHDKPVEYVLAEGQRSVAAAMGVITQHMRADPDYAWAWHCNIAMSCVDAGADRVSANQGAAKFLHLLASVHPAHPLPVRRTLPLADTRRRIRDWWVNATTTEV